MTGKWKLTFANEEDKERWEQTMILELVSSEESGVDDDEREYIEVHHLPFLSAEVREFFVLDLMMKHRNTSPLKRNVKT